MNIHWEDISSGRQIRMLYYLLLRTTAEDIHPDALSTLVHALGYMHCSYRDHLLTIPFRVNHNYDNNNPLEESDRNANDSDNTKHQHHHNNKQVPPYSVVNTNNVTPVTMGSYLMELIHNTVVMKESHLKEVHQYQFTPTSLKTFLFGCSALQMTWSDFSKIVQARILQILQSLHGSMSIKMMNSVLLSLQKLLTLPSLPHSHVVEHKYEDKAKDSVHRIVQQQRQQQQEYIQTRHLLIAILSPSVERLLLSAQSPLSPQKKKEEMKESEAVMDVDLLAGQSKGEEQEEEELEQEEKDDRKDSQNSNSTTRENTQQKDKDNHGKAVQEECKLLIEHWNIFLSSPGIL